MKDRADQKVYGTWGDSVRRRPVVWLLRAETSPDRVEQALTALIGITGCGLAGRPSVAVAHSFDNRHEPCHDLIGQEERADEDLCGGACLFSTTDAADEYKGIDR